MLDFYSGLRRPVTMQNASARSGASQLSEHGIGNVEAVNWNLGTAQLLEKAVQRQEGILSGGGALVVETGQFTGRSPKDKYVVREPGTESTVDWGAVNQPMQESAFDRILARLVDSCEGSELFVHDCFCGADPQYTLPIRVITQYAWHSLFARQLFIRPDPLASQEHVPEFTVFFAPSFQTDPEKDGTRSQTCIAVNFKKRIVIIAGTEYPGQLKKSIFPVLNYLLPAPGLMPIHCSPN